MTFDELEFKTHPNSYMNGVQALVKFSNDYGASVIKGDFSYGGSDGLYELAVTKTNEDGSWNLCYDSGLTEDVLGHLTEEEVTSYLQRIEAL